MMSAGTNCADGNAYEKNNGKNKICLFGAFVSIAQYPE